MPQRFYLRFLYAKTAVCSRIPEFAAYFLRTIPKVREKTENCRPDPCFNLRRPAVWLPKIELCSEIFNFSPHFWKHGESECPKAETRQLPLEKQPLNTKTAFRRFPRTKPDVPSQGLFTVGTLRKSPVPVKPLPEKSNDYELNKERRPSRRTAVPP